MFLKPFRVKTNSQLKNSERKIIKAKLLQLFPNLTESEVTNVFPNKELISSAKIVTHLNSTVVTYSVNKKVMLFEHNDTLYPTVYFLWYFPNLLPYFTTYAAVLSKLSSGADLMLPGVLLPNIEGPAKFGRFEKGAIVSVNTIDNKAPFAIGLTAHSSMDMFMAAGRGKCVNILHCANDYLCQMGGEIIISPELGPPDWLIKRDDKEKNVEKEDVEDQTSTEILVNDVAENITNLLTVDVSKDMDDLLTYCFLKALKYSAKKITLPVLTSNFYRLHMIPMCPEGTTLDIKRSSYKQLSKFLKEMKNDSLVAIAEQTKGVETITAINTEHPLLASFSLRDSDEWNPQKESSNNSNIKILDEYNVTAAVLPIFSDSGLRKGDALKAADVRKIVTDYVRKKNLQSLESRRMVIPNKEMAGVLKTSEEISWEELMETIFRLMSSSYKINYGQNEVSGKGTVKPIVMSVASRMGNKKVTLVGNLEIFGISAGDFGKECQHGCAASTSVTKPPGKKCEQLLVQGNQVAFIGNLLQEKYKIPKRYIRGLELAVKSKKKNM